MASIQANTSVIRSTASEIVSNSKQFKNAFDELYEQIHALKNTWTSEDGNAYIAKIDAQYETFVGLYNRLAKSAQALETAAGNYEQTVKANMV